MSSLCDRYKSSNHLCGVMISILVSNDFLGCEFEYRLGQLKDYIIGICCFSTKYAALRNKSEDRLALNQDNASRGVKCLPANCCWCRLAIQKYIIVQLSVLDWYKVDIILILFKCKLLSPWCSWKIAYLALSNSCLHTDSSVICFQHFTRKRININVTLVSESYVILYCEKNVICN